VNIGNHVIGKIMLRYNFYPLMCFSAKKGLLQQSTFPKKKGYYNKINPILNRNIKLLTKKKGGGGGVAVMGYKSIKGQLFNKRPTLKALHP
jgi:hypothetical protein